MCETTPNRLFSPWFSANQPGFRWVVVLIGLLLWLPGAVGADSSCPSDLAARTLLLDAARAGERICAVGERGHVLLSHNNGRTWRQVIAPTQATLTGVCFPDPENGWAVGHDAVILKSRDRGETWEKVHEDLEGGQPLLDVWFKTKDQGFALGAYGTCLKTRDGGKTWQQVRVSPEEWHLNRMAETDGNILYIAGEAGQVYRSGDGGASWQALDSPYEGSFFGLLALEGDEVLVFGLRGHVFRVTDAGRTWVPVATGTQATLADGLRLGDGRIVLVGLAGTVLQSDAPVSGFTPVPAFRREGLWSVLAGEGLICFGDMGAARLQVPDPPRNDIHITKRAGELP